LIWEIQTGKQTGVKKIERFIRGLLEIGSLDNRIG